jgi:hypothetical protein
VELVFDLYLEHGTDCGNAARAELTVLTPLDAGADLGNVSLEGVWRSSDGLPPAVETMLGDLLGRILDGVDFDLVRLPGVLDHIEPKVITMLPSKVHLSRVERDTVHVPSATNSLDFNVARPPLVQGFYGAKYVEPRFVVDVVGRIGVAPLGSLVLEDPVDGPVADFFVGAQFIVGVITVTFGSLTLGLCDFIAQKAAFWFLLGAGGTGGAAVGFALTGC